MAGILRKLAKLPDGGLFQIAADELRVIVQRERPRQVAPGDPPKAQIEAQQAENEWPPDDKYPKTAWR
jgi:hypothetical protein